MQSRHRWLKKPLAARPYHGWLIDQGSLTLRLQQRYQTFEVHLQQMQQSKVSQDEAALLRIAASRHMPVRDVLLMGNHQAVVYAHSVLSAKDCRGQWGRLNRLGARPLGAVLFANPQVRRAPICFKKLTPQHGLYQQASAHLKTKPNYLWARRSTFTLQCATILVTEVFLPLILDNSCHE
jgi:chorismate--pyruvate lyase